MAAMFGALNRFISRLDGDPQQQQQQEQQKRPRQTDSNYNDTAWGFQVLRNNDSKIPLEPWFDFIVGINGHVIDNPDPNLFTIEIRNCAGHSVTLEVWSAKGQRTHTVHIPIPPDAPPLGIALQLAPLSSTYNIWHVLSIPSSLSPAFTAGLLPHHDYIIGTPSGTLRGESALQELIEDHLNRPVVLWVYNSEFDVVREVELVPRRDWGGEGMLGAELAMGALHRLPVGIGEEIPEPGEALFDSSEPSQEAAGVSDVGGGNHFFVPADIAKSPSPAPVSGPTPPSAQLQSPPPPRGQSPAFNLAAPAAHGRRKPRTRQHAMLGGFDQYFAESEKQSREEDYALTKNTSPVPPPPPAGSRPSVSGSATGAPSAATQAEQAGSLAEVAKSMDERVQAFLSEQHEEGSILARVQAQARTSIGVIEEALQKYGWKELSFSYNGGKDCLVMLVLFLACLHRTGARMDEPTSEEGNRLPETIPTIYVQPKHPFPAVESFIHSSAETYRLDIETYTSNPPEATLKSVFGAYLAANPNIRAILVGTRRTDPFSAELEHFAPTDHGWPEFMRVHPMIDWRYAEIWAFIRHLGLVYCELYDQGYTSLGGMDDTKRNPKLEIEGGYKPAYELRSDDEERLGRE